MRREPLRVLRPDPSRKGQGDWILGVSFCEAPRTEPVIGPAQGWDPLARRRFAGPGPPARLVQGTAACPRCRPRV